LRVVAHIERRRDLFGLDDDVAGRVEQIVERAEHDLPADLERRALHDERQLIDERFPFFLLGDRERDAELVLRRGIARRAVGERRREPARPRAANGSEPEPLARDA
jgi:hypothetical protein